MGWMMRETLPKHITDRIEEFAHATAEEMIENKIVLPLELVLSHGARAIAEELYRDIQIAIEALELVERERHATAGKRSEIIDPVLETLKKKYGGGE